MKPEQWAELIDSFAKGRISRRQFVTKAAALGAAVPAATVFATGSVGAAPATGARASLMAYQTDAKTLVVADNMSGGLWLSLDPGRFYEVNPSTAMNVIYEPLYHIPDASKPDDFVPLLADGMPEISEDRLTATIKLRQGVKFHTSGNEMTADDWIFSWNRLKNLKANPSYLTTYWTKVEAVDPLTLKITLPSPNPALVAILTSAPLSVTDSKVVKEHGGVDVEGADTTDKATDWINANSVGTGPYQVTQWDVNTEVNAEKFADYWGDPVKLDRIIWRNIASTTGQLQAVQTGEADIAYSLDPDSVEEVKNDPALQLLTGPTISLEYVAMNVQDSPGGPLAKKQLRQAISYAIDYDGIIKELLGGAAIRPATVVPLPLPGSEAVENLAYKTDLAKAQELFDASGVGNIELSFSYRSGGQGQGGASEDTLATKIKSDLEKVKGLKVKLVPMDPTDWITDYRATKLQFTLAPWGPDYPDVLSYAEPFGGKDGSVAVRVGYDNPEIDSLLETIKSEVDAAKRTEGYTEIQKILIEDSPYAVIYQPTDQRAARKEVQGVTTHFLYGLQLRFASKSA